MERGQTKRNILTVTLNPAMDLFVNLKELHPGKLHRPSEYIKSPGGKGINVAKALNALGTPVLASGFLGGENGDWIKRHLQEDGIATRFKQISSETRMNFKIVEKNSRLTELNSPSPALSVEDWDDFEQILEQSAQGSEWIAFCGNLPEDAPTDWYEKVIRRCKTTGAKIALDTSGEALKLAVKAGPDFIKPNIEELRELSGKEIATPRDVIKIARELRDSGIATVAVTMGEKGMIVVREEGTWIVKVPRVKVISPVGAGDCVVGGFLHGLYQDQPIADTIRFAAACGAAAVSKPGTAQPERNDIKSLLQNIQIEKQEA